MGQNPGSECSFSLVMDLYGLPKDLPSVPVGPKGVELARAIEESISRDIDDRRLIPYLQFHEFEALLFSDLSVLAPLVEERDQDAFAALQASTAHLAPETIDDGPEMAPSKRLRAAIHNYDKVTHGPLGVSTLGIERSRARCPHFARWLWSLEELPLSPVWPELDRLAAASGIDVASAREHVSAVHAAVLERGERWSLPVMSSESSRCCGRKSCARCKSSSRVQETRAASRVFRVRNARRRFRRSVSGNGGRGCSVEDKSCRS